MMSLSANKLLRNLPTCRTGSRRIRTRTTSVESLGPPMLSIRMPVLGFLTSPSDVEDALLREREEDEERGGANNPLLKHCIICKIEINETVMHL